MLAGGGISRSSNKTMDTSRYGDGLASKSFSSVWSPKGLCLLHIGEIVKKKKSDVLFAVVNSLNNFYSTPKIFLFRYIVKKESSFIVKLLIFKIGS